MSTTTYHCPALALEARKAAHIVAPEHTEHDLDQSKLNSIQSPSNDSLTGPAYASGTL